MFEKEFVFVTKSGEKQIWRGYLKSLLYEFPDAKIISSKSLKSKNNDKQN